VCVCVCVCARARALELVLVLTESEEGVLGVHEHQHSPQQVLVHDVGLDVVGVVLHAERQELQDQRQQLSCLEVVCAERKTISHGSVPRRSDHTVAAIHKAWCGCCV